MHDFLRNFLLKLQNIFLILVTNMTEIPTNRRIIRYVSSKSSTVHKKPDYFLHFIQNPESETDMDNSDSSSDENDNL